MIIDAHQPIASSGTVHFNTEELAHIIETELAKHGFDRSVVLIIDPQHNPIFRYLLDFSDSQFQFYMAHMGFDPYVTLPFKDGRFAETIYLQEILPLSDVKSEVFLDVMMPEMGPMSHTLAGVYPLSSYHCLVFSAYSQGKPKLREQLLIDEFVQFLVHWANGWIAQCAMERQWQKLNTRSYGNTLVQGLTQAEQSVLLMLTQGLDGSEIAQHRRVSKETVRSQIKQLLHKTGSRHQNQLISRYFYNQLSVF